MRPGSAWDRFWFAEASLTRLAAFRILVMTLCLADFLGYAKTNLRDAAAVSAGTSGKPWNPIYAFELLGVQAPGIETARAAFVLGLVAIPLALVGLFTRLSTALAALVVLYWTAVNYSFGKVHHDKVTLAFTLMALPLAPLGARLSLDALLRRLWRARGGEAPPVPATSPLAGFPIRMCQLTLCIGYSAAGITKLAMRGLDWANGYTLMGILMHYDNDWSRTLSSSVELCRALSVWTLVVQGTLPLILFFPALRWFYLPAAIGFHLSTWKTMDTGPYMTLWFFFIAFLPLERIPGWLRTRVRSGSLPRAAFALVACLAPALLVLWILFLYFPDWMLLLLVPPAWALLLFLRAPRPLRVHVGTEAHVAAALLDALDWARCLQVERVPGAEVAVLAGGGPALAGAAAWRSLAWRLPPLLPLAWLPFLIPAGPRKASA